MTHGSARRARFEVLTSWAWNYATSDRTARLMVGTGDEYSDRR
jgi:hypothetical protein